MYLRVHIHVLHICMIYIYEGIQVEEGVDRAGEFALQVRPASKEKGIQRLLKFGVELPTLQMHVDAYACICVYLYIYIHIHTYIDIYI